MTKSEQAILIKDLKDQILRLQDVVSELEFQKRELERFIDDLEISRKPTSYPRPKLVVSNE